MLLSKTRRLFATTALLAIGLVSVASAASLEDVIASVNGEDVTLGEVLAIAEQVPSQGAPTAEYLQQLVDQYALQTIIAEKAEPSVALELRMKAAARLAQVNSAIEAYLAENLTEEFLQAQYDELIGNAPDQEEWSAAHILVESEEAANDVIARLDAGEEFATLAGELSSDPGSGANGGDLGWFGAGQMVPVFEDAVRALENGAVSAPVQSQFGWHVIKRNDARTQPKPTLEEVRPQLEPYASEILVQQYLEEIQQGAEISIVEGIDPSILDTKLQ